MGPQQGEQMNNSLRYDKISSHRRANYVYLSRRFSLAPLSTKDLPLEHLEMPNKVTATLFKLIELTVPFSYLYILFLFLSEMRQYFPDIIAHSKLFSILIPLLIEAGTRPFMTTWALLESLFYVLLRLHIFYLQRKCPLECSLKAAPFQTLEERKVLWKRLIRNVKSDPVSWISGWFFDEPIEQISHYDIMDFLTWSMFEGRSQEHLTVEETAQLDTFLIDVEDLFRRFLNDEDFHFHEQEDPQMSSIARVFDQINRSAIATRKFIKDSSQFHSPNIAQKIYENSLNVYEHSRECFDHFSDEAQSYLLDNSIQLSNFIDQNTKPIRQKLESYKILLENARKMPIQSKHMASLLHEISNIYSTLHDVEQKALDAMKVHIRPFFRSRRALRYAQYSQDPLVGIRTYPLSLHLFMIFCTDTLLRVCLNRRRFKRFKVGQISYYYYLPMVPNNSTPIVFCHGIGIGLLPYLGFIDLILKLNRPILLPEIPYVTGFRIWKNLNSDSVLPPHSVASNIVSMLASHGHTKASFIGHSYGTSWLSFICKHAKDVVDAVVFLDPICFCLHQPFLTKQFVYHRANPGSVSYIIRSDVNVHWTIQRCFPWQQVSLFTEEIPSQAVVFYSEDDTLVPSKSVEEYLASEGAVMMNESNFRNESVRHNSMCAIKLRKLAHGDFIESQTIMRIVVDAVNMIGQVKEKTR